MPNKACVAHIGLEDEPLKIIDDMIHWWRVEDEKGYVGTIHKAVAVTPSRPFDNIKSQKRKEVNVGKHKDSD